MLFTLIVCTILSLEADFKQVKETRLLQEPQVATGHLSYRSPDQLCWEYLTPTAYKWELGSTSTSPQVQQLLQFIIRSISGDNLRDNAAFSVTQLSPTDTQQGNTLSQQNGIDSQQNNTATAKGNANAAKGNTDAAKGSTTYLLVPKKRDLRQLFQSIEITLNPATQVAERVVLTEKNGDRSTISFHNLHLE